MSTCELGSGVVLKPPRSLRTRRESQRNSRKHTSDSLERTLGIGKEGRKNRKELVNCTVPFITSAGRGVPR
jgi:hypothetical protein